MFSRLGSDFAEKVEQRRSIRLDCENLPANPLGSLQPAGSMVLCRDRQCFGNRCHDVNYDNTTANRNVPQENWMTRQIRSRLAADTTRSRG